jgi:hypothetical protein
LEAGSRSVWGLTDFMRGGRSPWLHAPQPDTNWIAGLTGSAITLEFDLLLLWPE